MISVGLQLPNFTYPDIPHDRLFEALAETAQVAEESGFDSLFVMDHFFQLPMLGPPELEMLEGYTLLGALAARTQRADLGTLVTGVTYRNPAHVAKIVTTLDVVSGGRALLGIGAAWYAEEHEALGWRFPPVVERFELLEDALNICRAMFTQPQTTFEGRRASVTGAWNAPPPLRNGGPPILVGGTGERRTLRLAARYADAANFNCSFDELPRKLEVLAGHCADLDRDPASIRTSCLGIAVVGRTHEDAIAALAAMVGRRGIDPAALPLDDPEERNKLLPRLLVGSPDEITEQAAAVLATGLDGIVVNMPDQAIDTEAVALAGGALAAAQAGVHG